LRTDFRAEFREEMEMGNGKWEMDQEPMCAEERKERGGKEIDATTYGKLLPGVAPAFLPLDVDLLGCPFWLQVLGTHTVLGAKVSR
jgi:hypothetical protein